MVLCYIGYILCVLIVVVLLLYLCLELHYFLRMFLTVILARLCKNKAYIMDETTINGICLTNDVDTLLNHMNNARFIRELDFAKVDFYERTGLYRHLRSVGGSLALGATTVRYRRFVRLFTKYTITSKVVYWDDQSIYMEHRFINPGDKFINAIVLTKIRLINCSAEDVMEHMLSLNQDVESQRTKLKPGIPQDVEKWLEYNTLSSALLRND